MRARLNTRSALLGVALATVVSGGVAAPASAQVSVGELLGWCDGALRPDQMGAINAFQCVNYLQGATEMFAVAAGLDIAACFDPAQPVGAQLMARMAPAMRAASENDPALLGQTPAAFVVSWLQNICGVEPAPPAEPAVVAPQTGDDARGETPDPELTAARAALVAAEAALRSAREGADVDAARIAELELALADNSAAADAAARSCRADMETLQARFDAAVADNQEQSYSLAELELELAAGSAVAAAQRQQIAAAEAEAEALRRETEDARAAADRAEAELARVSDGDALSERAREAMANAEQLVNESEQRVSDAEAQARAAQAEARSAEAERDSAATELAARVGELADMQAEIDRLRAQVGDRDAEIAAMSGRLDQCVARALTPSEQTASAPAPVAARSDPNEADAAVVSIDPQSLAAFRSFQFQVVAQAELGERRPWTGPGGRFSGYAVVLQDMFQAGAPCREIYSQIGRGGAVIEQGKEFYCRRGGVWVYSGSSGG